MASNERSKSRRRRKRCFPLLRSIKNDPVPPQKLVRLKYSEQVSLDPAAASMAHFLFRANSTFDPNQTGIGHQPMGLDAWTIFYNLYTVVKSVIKVTFFSTVATELANGKVGIYLNDNNTSTNIMDTMVEFRRANHTNIGPCVGDRGIVSVMNSYTPKKLFGRSAKQYIGSANGQGINGNSGTNPVDTAVYDVFAGPAATADNMAETNLMVEIWYTCMLTDRQTLPGS